MSPPPDTVYISAAMSTHDAVEAVTKDFTQQTGIPVIVTPAASSTLARQIENGENADLFLSADEEWADYLDKRGLVAQRGDLLGNRLVVIEPAAEATPVSDLHDLSGDHFQRLAIGRAEVPAGYYARQALEKAGVWKDVEKRVLEGGDVGAVLTYVERGEVEAGFVYATDAQASSRVRVAYSVPAELHEPIRYPLVRLKRNAEKASAGHFYEFLHGEAAQKHSRLPGLPCFPDRAVYGPTSSA